MKSVNNVAAVSLNDIVKIWAKRRWYGICRIAQTYPHKMIMNMNRAGGKTRRIAIISKSNISEK